MALVNMARTKKEVQEEQKEMKAGLDAPLYPWGLTLRLDDETIKKLGIAIPEGGAKMRIDAIASVSSVSSRQEVDGETCSSIELQITDLALTPETGTPKAEMASKLYD